MYCFGTSSNVRHRTDDAAGIYFCTPRHIVFSIYLLQRSILTIPEKFRRSTVLHRNRAMPRIFLGTSAHVCSASTLRENVTRVLEAIGRELPGSFPRIPLSACQKYPRNSCAANGLPLMESASLNQERRFRLINRFEELENAGRFSH